MRPSGGTYWTGSLVEDWGQILNILDLQRDMRDSYYWGATGVLTSALVWCCAGFVSLMVSATSAVWALFIGGALIHPISVMMDKLLGRRGKHDPKNPLGPLAIASTLWLIFCLPIAYVVSTVNLSWFFPSMLVVIGGRYLTFAVVFGLKVYWVLGGSLAAAAYLLVKSGASPTLGAFTGSVIEFMFSVILFLMAIRANPSNGRPGIDAGV